MDGRFGGRAAARFKPLVASLEGRIDAVAAAGLEAVRASGTSWMLEADAARQQLRVCLRGSLRAEVEGFLCGALPKQLPEPDLTMMALAARVGDLASLLTAYRHFQMGLWQSWFDLVEEEVEHDALRRELLAHGSDYFFRYMDRVSRYATEGYEREVQRTVTTGEHRRFQAIKALFDGEPDAASQLDVELRQYHLGFVAWGPGANVAARDLAAGLGRPILLSLHLEDNWWGWISGPHRLSAKDGETIRRWRPPVEVKIAFGLEGFGEPGFRATNHQALRAHWVGAATESSVVHYEDVAVEALAGEAEADARAFVAHELHGIDDESADSRRLRQTLIAYFKAELNAASAAAALGVHHQTVLSRLRAVEERLGRPVGANRVELEIALRLRACFSPCSISASR